MCGIGPAAAEAPAASSGGETLERYLRSLNEVASLYLDNALSFSCEEKISDSDFGRKTYRSFYVYRYSEDQGLDDFRLRYRFNPRKGFTPDDVVELGDFDLPVSLSRAYSWIFIFEENKREVYRYALAGEDEVQYGRVVLGQAAPAAFGSGVEGHEVREADLDALRREADDAQVRAVVEQTKRGLLSGVAAGRLEDLPLDTRRARLLGEAAHQLLERASFVFACVHREVRAESGDALEAGGVAWLHVGWYHRSKLPGMRRRGGHWLTVVQIEEQGASPVLTIRDPAPYAGVEETLERIKLRKIEKGWMIDHRAAFPAKGYYELTEGLELKRPEDIPIVDGAVILVVGGERT